MDGRTEKDPLEEAAVVDVGYRIGVCLGVHQTHKWRGTRI